MAETTDVDLYNLAEKIGLKIDYICFLSDLINCKKKTNYIINLMDPAHWVGLYVKGNKAWYFNSFSSELMDVPKEIIHFLRKHNITMYYDSDKPVQRPIEGHCGEFVIDFLLYLNRKGNPTDNYDLFLNHLHSTIKDIRKYKKKHKQSN
jgi:hypothetical protein